MPRNLLQEDRELNKPRNLLQEDREANRPRNLVREDTEERSFMAKHPNIYGLGGATKEVIKTFIPFFKYIDKSERDLLIDALSNQEEKDLWSGLASQDPRGYYLQDLNKEVSGDAMMIMGYMTGGAELKPIAKASAEWFKKNTPTFYKLFTKKIGVSTKVADDLLIKEVPTPDQLGGPERYSAPAVRAEDGTIVGVDFRKGGHIEAINKLSPEQQAGKIEEGMMTSEGRFVKRPTDKMGDIDVSDLIGKEINPTELSPIEKITKAIQEAKPVRKAQEAVYSEERSKRLGAAIRAAEKRYGQEKLPAALGELKVEIRKVDFEPLKNITQEDTDSIFETAWNHPDIKGFEKPRILVALSKLFGEKGVTVPQQNEIALLERVFPKDFINALQKNRTVWEKFMGGVGQAINIPKSLMASFDLSAPFRQGLFLIGKPKRFFQSFKKMFGQFASEKTFAAAQEVIKKKATYDLMESSGLSLTTIGKRLSTREEAFMSQWAEKIPLIGRGVRASERAYVGFLNKLRADVFEDLVINAEKLGLDPRKNEKLVKEIANFVNTATGRGSLGKLEGAAVALNGVFFSPRLIASRVTLLNPVYYIKADPFVRKEALKSLFALTGLVGTTLGVSAAAGLKVGTDIRSADFGKIKVGNTRIDFMGGFQQYIRMAGQLMSGEYVNSTTGQVEVLGEGYRPLTRKEILYRQVEGKFSPIVSFAKTMLEGRSAGEKDLNIKKEITQRFVPMVIQDMYEMAQSTPELLPVSILGVFGVGVQTYGKGTGKLRKIRRFSGGGLK